MTVVIVWETGEEVAETDSGAMVALNRAPCIRPIVPSMARIS